MKEKIIIIILMIVLFIAMLNFIYISYMFFELQKLDMQIAMILLNT